MLDLSTNANEIKNTIRAIEKGSKSWCWLGYSGTTNTIVVKSSGDDIEEMLNHVKPSDILYGYAKFSNESALVSKYAYIIWLGSSSLRKEIIQHIKNSEQITKLYKTIHLRMTAREKSDVNWVDISNRIFGGSYNKPCDENSLNCDEFVTGNTKSSSNSTDIMKGIVAARIKALYEQKSNSSYVPLNFREELEAARAVPRDPIDPIRAFF
ncbi:unnamed protein product [Hymenolepis diminuta]|uniref:ADF-H domain-containing protein n=1 Tax=Hymenolepis diminuta TaxID=6216 RepID=A0A564YMV8_HYMDI|nr:unnamed protein product [Hymenolepis diminuta]